MRFTATLFVLTMTAATAFAAEPRPPQAPGLPALAPLDVCDCIVTGKCDCPTCDCPEQLVFHRTRNVPDLPELAKATFWDAKAWEHARHQTLPICIWVGQEPKEVPGFLHFRGFAVAGFHAPVGVLIDRPVDGQLVVLAKLTGHPTAETILSYLNVQSQATDSSEGDDVACGKRRGGQGGRQGRGLFRGGRRGGC